MIKKSYRESISENYFILWIRSIILSFLNSMIRNTNMIEREHIGIFGKMNSGKSSIMNLLTQQQTSIVDPTPGTTADTKVSLHEIHSLGPVKLFDTAGLDEDSRLGDKKRVKVFSDLKECDLILLVVDLSTGDFSTEKEIIDQAREEDKQLLIVYNLFKDEHEQLIPEFENHVPLSRFYKKINLKAIDNSFRMPLIDLILENYESKNISLELLPFIEQDEFYVLNIPMDEETPSGRFLRPQQMCVEYITSNWAYPVSYRMDLKRARANDHAEKNRFLDFIDNMKKRPKAIITDSQAMDIMSLWTPPDIHLTTFSIMMINYISKGRLDEFVAGVKSLENIAPGSRILIAEACNHSRIQEDIGTVQIPSHIEKNYPGVVVEHNFGREFQENKELTKYDLIIHCGACMISPQKLSARIRDLQAVGVPYTNYGVFLSYIQGKAALGKVLEPWGLRI